MVFLVALIMSAVVFGVIAHPLLRPSRSEPAAVPLNGRRREELLSQRDAAYSGIRELDFEHQLGNLSRQDYEDLRARYRDRAADILQQLDALEREEIAACQQGGASRSPDGGAQDEIEQALASLRQQRGGKAFSSPGRMYTRTAGSACPTCHQPVDRGDRFCGNCGTAQHRLCPACAIPSGPAQLFCARCGERLPPP